MKLVVISDTHNKHEDLTLGSGDVLIHCGDSCTKGNYTEAETFLWWFAKQNFKYKIYVPGNHDKKFKKREELQHLSSQLGIHTLRNAALSIDGINFWGGDFVPQVRDDKYKQTLEEREAAWADMPTQGVDVLITHAPPKYILDTNRRGEHCGCDVLLNKVLKLNPSVHVFGHLHLHGGQSFYNGNTRFYNVSTMDEDYQIVRGGTTIEI